MRAIKHHPLGLGNCVRPRIGGLTCARRSPRNSNHQATGRRLFLPYLVAFLGVVALQQYADAAQDDRLERRIVVKAKR